MSFRIQDFRGKALNDAGARANLFDVTIWMDVIDWELIAIFNLFCLFVHNVYSTVFRATCNYTYYYFFLL